MERIDGIARHSSLEDALKRISHGISGTYYVPIVLGSGTPSKDILRKTKEDITNILQSAQAEPINSMLSYTFKKYAEIVELLLDIPGQDMMKEQGYVRALQAFGNLFALRFDCIKKGDTIKMLDEERELLSSGAKLIPQQIGGAGNHPNSSAYKLMELGDKYRELLDIYRAYGALV